MFVSFLFVLSFSPLIPIRAHQLTTRFSNVHINHTAIERNFRKSFHAAFAPMLFPQKLHVWTHAYAFAIVCVCCFECVHELCVCDLALFRVVLYTNKFISIWLFMIVLFGFIGMHIWIENCVHGSVIVWQFENMLYESYSSWHNNKLPPRTTHIYVYAYYANRANCFKSNILPFRLFRLSFVWYSLCSSHNFKLSQRKSMVRLLNCIESTFQSTNHRSWLVPIKIKLISTIPN